MVTAEDEQPASVLLRWDVPNSQELITRYDYSLDGGAWTDTTTTANVYRLAGLDAGTTYSVRVRAASANGNGPASVARSFSTVSEQAPGLSRFVTATAPGGSVHVDLSWLPPGQYRMTTRSPTIRYACSLRTARRRPSRIPTMPLLRGASAAWRTGTATASASARSTQPGRERRRPSSTPRCSP